MIEMRCLENVIFMQIIKICSPSINKSSAYKVSSKCNYKLLFKNQVSSPNPVKYNVI